MHMDGHNMHILGNTRKGNMRTLDSMPLGNNVQGNNRGNRNKAYWKYYFNLKENKYNSNIAWLCNPVSYYKS